MYYNRSRVKRQCCFLSSSLNCPDVIDSRLILVTLTWNRLQTMGGLDVNKVVKGDEGWRLLSCNWLHGGVVHLLVNMLTLLFIGIRMEREFGFSKYLPTILPILIDLLSCEDPFLMKYVYITFVLIFVCSSDWIALFDIGIWRKHIVSSFPPLKHLCWSIWCRVWFTWRNAL